MIKGSWSIQYLVLDTGYPIVDTGYWKNRKLKLKLDTGNWITLRYWILNGHLEDRFLPFQGCQLLFELLSQFSALKLTVSKIYKLRLMTKTKVKARDQRKEDDNNNEHSHDRQYSDFS